MRRTGSGGGGGPGGGQLAFGAGPPNGGSLLAGPGGGVGAGSIARGPGGGGGGATGATGLYQDFCCTLTQMRVLAKATFEINSVVAAANQRCFIECSLFASPLVQPACHARPGTRLRASHRTPSRLSLRTRAAHAARAVEPATPRCQALSENDRRA